MAQLKRKKSCYGKRPSKEKLSDVLKAIEKFYEDLFSDPHPFELADQPAIVRNMKNGIAGCDLSPIKRAITLPSNSPFNVAYLKLTLGIQ